MPIAAVPAYLGQDFSEASPGMRFGMYLLLWGVNERTQENLWTTHDLTYQVRGQQQQERALRQENKNQALSKASQLNANDRKTLEALAQRQAKAFLSVGSDGARMAFHAVSVAPFTTGLGNEHPLENGFAFLSPYGLPYLAGTGVKGVVRMAARELASGEWGTDTGWTGVAGDDGLNLSDIDALFGLESEDQATQHVRGALQFWDVIPQMPGDRLAVEIMTPHQGHYYQQKKDGKTADLASPHESGQPIPINFLSVPPGSGFVFHVQCDLAHLQRIAPRLLVDAQWQTLLKAALRHAYEWLGFGAKTAVGYGAMKEDAKAIQREARQREDAQQADAHAKAEQARTAELAAMPALEREIQAFLDARADKGQPAISALTGALKTTRWQGDTHREVAVWLQAEMRRVNKWKEKSEKKNPDKDNDHQDTLRVMAWLKSP